MRALNVRCAAVQLLHLLSRVFGVVFSVFGLDLFGADVGNFAIDTDQMRGICGYFDRNVLTLK